MDTLIKVLKNRRIKMGKTQEYISKKIYVAQHTLSEYENERKEIKLSRLQDIAKELDGEIKFIPNEKIKTMNLHCIKLIGNDKITKNILEDEDFKVAFKDFIEENISYTYEYSLELGTGLFEDDIIQNEKTENSKIFKMENNICKLDFKELEEELNEDIVIGDKLYEKENIVYSLYNLNEDTSNYTDCKVCEMVYDFVKEYIEENQLNYFKDEEEYENYLNEEDFFVIFKVNKLYDKLDNSKETYDYFIR